MAGDITQDDIVKKLDEHIKTKFGKLDILVNNALMPYSTFERK